MAFCHALGTGLGGHSLLCGPGYLRGYNARRHGNDAIARNNDHGGRGLFQKPKLLPACTIHNNNKILGVAVDRHSSKKQVPDRNKARPGLKKMQGVSY